MRWIVKSSSVVLHRFRTAKKATDYQLKRIIMEIKLIRKYGQVRFEIASDERVKIFIKFCDFLRLWLMKFLALIAQCSIKIQKRLSSVKLNFLSTSFVWFCLKALRGFSVMFLLRLNSFFQEKFSPVRVLSKWNVVNEIYWSYFIWIRLHAKLFHLQR